MEIWRSVKKLQYEGTYYYMQSGVPKTPQPAIYQATALNWCEKFIKITVSPIWLLEIFFEMQLTAVRSLSVRSQMSKTMEELKWKICIQDSAFINFAHKLSKNSRHFNAVFKPSFTNAARFPKIFLISIQWIVRYIKYVHEL